MSLIYLNKLQTMDNFYNTLNYFLDQIDHFFSLPIVNKIKYIVLFLTLILIVIWVILLIRTNKIKDQVEKYKTFWMGRKHEKKHSVAVWRNIEHLMSAGDKESLKQAFLLMNELLTEVLNRIVSSGDNLIDKVKNLKIAEISESDKAKLLVGVYAYDKIKNDPTFNLESNEIEFFFKLYRQIFVQLELLEE